MFRARDFRGACDKFGELRALVLPTLPTMALTVAASETSLVYIVKKVSMDHFTLVKGSNNRKNISLCCFKSTHINTMTMKRWTVLLGSVSN